MTHIRTISILSSKSDGAGYPIQACVVDVASGREWCWLIRPLAQWLIQDSWCGKHERRHGVSQRHLVRDGILATTAAYELFNVLEGCSILSDAPERDAVLLGELYRDSGLASQRIEDAADILPYLTVSMGEASEIEISRAREAARARFDREDANGKSRCLAEMIRILINQEYGQVSSLLSSIPVQSGPENSDGGVQPAGGGS